jgi:hypothetical protein
MNTETKLKNTGKRRQWRRGQNLVGLTQCQLPKELGSLKGPKQQVCKDIHQSPHCSKMQVCTMAAERQDPDFLIGPRNKKTGKKRPTIKILYPPVQIAS